MSGVLELALADLAEHPDSSARNIARRIGGERRSAPPKRCARYRDHADTDTPAGRGRQGTARRLNYALLDIRCVINQLGHHVKQPHEDIVGIDRALVLGADTPVDA